MEWHPIVPVCPGCEKHINVNKVCMNAEGKLRVVGVCPKCEGDIECHFFPEEVIASCKELDAETSNGFDLAKFEQEGKAH